MKSEQAVPKLNGFDIELGNFVDGADMPGGTGREASMALRRRFEGISPSTRWGTGYAQQGWSAWASWSAWSAWPGTGGSERGEETGLEASDGYASVQPPLHSTDWGRKWLPSNGACGYIDLNHFEICSPEVLGARDHVAAWHAMLLKTRQARILANEGLPDGQSIEVLANNSDGMGNSYGGHVDMLVSRRCYRHVLHRKPHLLAFLATHQASSIVYAGQGKVGSENGRPEANYQFSQRADFVEQLLAPQTTYHRPLVNTRDESLCGTWRTRDPVDAPEAGFARLHVISYDTNLAHVATFLKVGALQLVLCLLERELVDPSLILDDPVLAMARWSHGDLSTRARLASGDRYTAVEVQEAILEKAAALVSDGHTEGLVPEADLIVRHWADTLKLLRQKDIHGLARRCDWALKLVALDRAMRKHQMEWASPDVKMLDHLYSSIDVNRGLYWQYERAGLVDRIVSEADVERAAAEPPANTRAWLRAHLLRLAEPGDIEAVDWDSIRFRTRGSGMDRRRRLYMSNPLRFTRDECADVCRSAESLPELLDALGVEGDETFSFGESVAVPARSAGARTDWDDRRPPRLLSAYCGGDMTVEEEATGTPSVETEEKGATDEWTA